LSGKLAELVHLTALEFRTVVELVQQCQEQYGQFVHQWSARYEPVRKAIENYRARPTRNNEAMSKLLESQERQMHEESLLTAMVRQGFLPGYGFPVHVLSFNTTSLISNARSQAQAKKSDVAGRQTDMPRRDVSMGLVEYAPGAEVVIDEQVYQSAGLSLSEYGQANADHNRLISACGMYGGVSLAGQ